MVGDELVLVGLAHSIERVELTFEVTLELATGLNDLGHDLVTLSLGDSGSEGVVLKVSSNTDTSGLDHGGLVLGKRGALELVGVHVGDMLVTGRVTVVLLDDLVKHFIEAVVGVVGSGVDTDSRVEVHASGEEASLEGDTAGVGLVFVLFPDLLGEVSGESGVGALGELWHISEFIGVFEEISTVSEAFGGGGTHILCMSGAGTTHCLTCSLNKI